MVLFYLKVGEMMDVYLKNDKEKSTFHFPVNPFGITVNRNKKYETAEIIDVGEIDFADNSEKIKELSFETLLPSEYDTYCRYLEVPNPIEAMQTLEKWMEQKEPVRLIITNFDFNDLVIIASINEEERAGEIGDKYITINYRAWRELKIETLSPATTSTVKTTQLKSNRPTTSSKQKTYTVVSGDTLYKIAKKFYGNGSKWQTIYNNAQNKKVIGSNPSMIYPQQKLVIP